MFDPLVVLNSPNLARLKLQTSSISVPVFTTIYQAVWTLLVKTQVNVWPTGGAKLPKFSQIETPNLLYLCASFHNYLPSCMNVISENTS